MIVDQPKIGDEIRRMPREPLLPIEKKLIGWSLGLGIGLLFVLVFVSRTWFPAG